MSTKLTKYAGKQFHIYEDCFDQENGLYIELEGIKEYSVNFSESFDNRYNNIKLLISKSLWEEMREKIIEDYEKERKENER